MASLDREYNSFSIEDLSILYISDGQEKTVNIKGLVEQIEITENIISPVITGSVLVIDTFNLGKLLRTGSCFLRMKISKSGKDDFVYEKTARIYKQEKRKSQTPNSEIYVLYFCSEEMILSEQTKVSKGYKDTYSNVAKNILNEFLNISDNECIISDTKGVKNVVIPALKPLNALFWCASRAVNSQDIPDLMFFENKNGFNFISLSDLFAQDSIPINFSAKNTALEDDKSDLFGVKSSQITKQFNLLESIKKGTYSNAILGYDMITRTFFKQNIKAEYYDKAKRLNQKPIVPSVSNKKGTFAGEAYDSKWSFVATDSQYSLSNYAKKNYPNMKQHLPEFSLAHRSSIMSFLNTKKMKMMLPGNFGLTVGMILNLQYPKRGSINEEDPLDPSFSGNHMILAVRHVIRPSQHETIIEIASDSEMDGD